MAWLSQLVRSFGLPVRRYPDVKSRHAKIGELTLENDF
jgi:hypothetical protein